MIGNLFNAFVLAGCSAGLAITGYVGRESHDRIYRSVSSSDIPVSEVSSLISDNLGTFYSPSIDFTMAVSVENTTLPSVNNNMIKRTYGSNLVSTYDGEVDSLIEYVGTEEDSYYPCGSADYFTRSGTVTTGYYFSVAFDFVSRTDFISWNSNSYVIDGFEFHPFVLGYDSDGNASEIDFTLWLGDNSVSISADTGLYYGVYGSSYVGISVEDGFITFPTISLSISLDDVSSDIIDFDFYMKGRWMCNYASSIGYGFGYTIGYSSGYSNGYSTGYSDGLSLADNGDFMSLFNGIADTPLRFIYGLFNFKLFGVNVLVIVLSLLTFVFVFHIIKKVWK